MSIFEDLDQQYFPGFERRTVALGDGQVHALVGGSGPPVLLLHGDPQTHLCWHAIAPAFAKDRTVVLADLRGRGESHKPGPTPDHLPYAKRTMATEMLALMHRLGHDHFDLVGHDRGARVAQRLASDYPGSVRSLTIMDIVPVIDLYERTTAAIAHNYIYFYFLTQPHPWPERLIAGDPAGFMGQILTGLGGAITYPQEVLDLYLRSATAPTAITAMCECFRAGATIDIEHDTTDLHQGRRLAMPCLVLWGSEGVVGRCFDVPGIWRNWAPGARFQTLACGHFLPEEAPDGVLAALRPFLAEAA